METISGMNDKPKKPTSVSMIEDNEIIKKNVCKFLSLHEEFEIVEVFSSMEAFLYKKEVDPSFKFDVLLLDIGLPGISGIEGIPKIIDLMPEADIIMLTTYEEEETILKAICAGACSYLSKKASLAEILECIRVVVKGGSYMSPSIAREIVMHLMGGRISKATILSPRQKEIIQALVDGKTYKSIAKELFISTDTVKGHIKKMYKTLQVNNKAEAIAMYLRGEIS
jgi:DNA-binding NarL/FixJ family response regulator